MYETKGIVIKKFLIKNFFFVNKNNKKKKTRRKGIISLI
jgi:hypothetical protein